MSGCDLTFLKNPLILLIVRVGPVLILKCLWSIFTKKKKYNTQNIVFCMTKLYIILGKIVDHMHVWHRWNDMSLSFSKYCVSSSVSQFSSKSVAISVALSNCLLLAASPEVELTLCKVKFRIRSWRLTRSELTSPPVANPWRSGLVGEGRKSWCLGRYEQLNWLQNLTKQNTAQLSYVCL